MRRRTPIVLLIALVVACGDRGDTPEEVTPVLDALAASYPVTAPLGPYRKGTLGGLNMWAYCLSLGYPTVGYRRGYVQGPDAAHDNWVCQRGTEQLAPVDARLVDMTEACRWQYGREDVVARPADPDHAWSWNCHGL